ncbi:MAG: hypothetical protein K1X78_28155 [Verrucomicrobiaceae bacterium]|nr:hypothetical protein [Verrucomicrobiaceae bacterium]
MKLNTSPPSLLTRRDCLRAALFAAAPSPLIAADTCFIRERRTRTLSFIEAMRFKDGAYGRYRYSADMPEPTLYSSTYAAMTRSLYRDLDSLSKSQREEWIAYLQSHQDDDGLFRDPRIFGEGWYKDDPEWCGRRHLSCHVVTALTCLGAVAAKPMTHLEPFYDKAKLTAWLEARDWRKADFAGNEVLNIGTLLQYTRDFQKEPRAAEAMRVMLDWLTHHHLNEQSGLWGSYDVSKGDNLSRAVMGAYHFWLLYFYDRVPVPHTEAAIAHILRTQGGKDNGFGQGVHGPHSSACEDIDSIDPLARLSRASPQRAEIEKALARVEDHVWSHQNNDGGFTWIRGTKFQYGHPLLAAPVDGSAMFPTWFRTLALAYLGQALPTSRTGAFDWHFAQCPGIQFYYP